MQHADELRAILDALFKENAKHLAGALKRGRAHERGLILKFFLEQRELACLHEIENYKLKKFRVASNNTLRPRRRPASSLQDKQSGRGQWNTQQHLHEPAAHRLG